jgi:pyruvate ferredoxin oxidoreductase delta subunit
MKHPWEVERPKSAWLPGGLSRKKTGKISRASKPVLDSGKCNRCDLCWIYCPEGCISRGRAMTIDYRDCRGCGVCATECPKKAIEMKKEDQE